ncbi:MAG: ABC transporter ATP-binding protein [Phycisphaerales bacterium]
MTHPMIEARNLTRRFGRHRAVDGISFDLAGGGVYGLLGPNGAGKTTTIRMITALIAPTSGTVRVDGIDTVANPVAARRRIGYLPESTPLDLHARVHEYLRFRADLSGVPRRRRAAAIDRAIERADLTEVRRRPIRQLSKGFRQRVGLAAAIVHEPPVLVLDEPTVGLDPRQIQEVRGLVRKLSGDHTIILSTHILPEAESVCDEVLLLARGRVRASGPIAELRRGRAEGPDGQTSVEVETDRDARAILESAAAGRGATVEVVEGHAFRYVVTGRAGAGSGGSSAGAAGTGSASAAESPVGLAAGTPVGSAVGSAAGSGSESTADAAAQSPAPKLAGVGISAGSPVASGSHGSPALATTAATAPTSSAAGLPEYLGAALVAGGVGIRELRPRRETLEELFIGIVNQAEGVAAEHGS